MLSEGEVNTLDTGLGRALYRADLVRIATCDELGHFRRITLPKGLPNVHLQGRALGDRHGLRIEE